MKPFSLNLRQRLVRFERPVIMGIVNLTDDSFYAPSRVGDSCSLMSRVGRMVSDGADIIDLGACSTRPGSEPPSAVAERDRIVQAVADIRRDFPDLPLSVDTYRADVAAAAIEAGADIINDVSGGSLDPAMFDTVASLHVPYVLMHMRGTPADMQQYCQYGDVAAEVISELSHKLYQLALKGVCDIIVDPGFGFAKTTAQNYQLLDHLADLSMLGRPILAGVSRKSMITRLVGADAALNGTTVVNTMALDRGADILRVHDVAAARQAVTIYCATINSQTND